MNLWSLQGLLDYSEVKELQLKLLEKRIRDQISDTWVFLEHNQVFTRGRGLQWTAKPRPRHMPVPTSLSVIETERGGDLTYHGPGQLVVYPVCKLMREGFAPDIASFLRQIEQLVIDVLLAESVVARTQSEATGVWVGSQKIASLGIAVRKWVTFHGLALNVVNDLAPFFQIAPCGFAPEKMTRLIDQVPCFKIPWRSRLEEHFTRLLMKQAEGQKREELTLKEAFQRLKE